MVFSAHRRGSAATGAREHAVTGITRPAGLCLFDPRAFRRLDPVGSRPTTGGEVQGSPDSTVFDPVDSRAGVRPVFPPVQVIAGPGSGTVRSSQLTRSIAPRHTSGSWAQDAFPS